jgi:diguanylate cyclase (GGDEF)-like protein
MDPLVACALNAQRALALSLGTATGLAGAAFLLLAPETWIRGPLGISFAVAIALSLAWRLYRRFGKLDPAKSSRRELEIGVHLAPLCYAVILFLPGGLDGPFHAFAYALMMGVAAFFATSAASITLLSSVALEWLLGSRHRVAVETTAVHIAMLLVFAAANSLFFRGEIRRVRRLSRQRLESELLRLREAARDYRLTGASRSAADGAALRVSAPQGDEERLLQSSLDHLQGSLTFVLFLLRASLGAKTAALLWLNDDERSLSLRTLSTAREDHAAGPFSAREGIFAAALSSQQMVTFSEARATGRMPLAGASAPSGALGAVAIEEHGRALGVLLVEADPGRVLAGDAERLLRDAGHFALRAVENERLFLSLQRAKIEQGKLYQAADMLADARSEVAVIRAGVESARQFAQFDFAAVTLHHRSNNSHEICAVSGTGADQLVGAVFPHNSGLVSMVVANQHPLPYRGEYRRSQQVVFSPTLPMPELPSLIILPLRVHDAALGTLVLGSNTPGAFGEGVRPTLEVLARHVSVSLANARMVKRLEDLATTDGMTSLLNKRALIDVARQKIRSAERFDKPLSVIVGDIDHFKRVNDEYGHDIGDVVIRGFADALRRSKRETDAVGRFGGEEFVVVCEETDAEGARLLAERIRTELGAVTFHTPKGPLSVTCSLGVATRPFAGSDWETLFKATDEALYVSKRAGRDRVSVWSPSMRGAAA